MILTTTNRHAPKLRVNAFQWGATLPPRYGRATAACPPSAPHTGLKYAGGARRRHRPSCSALGELESPNDPLELHTYHTVRVEMTRALWRVSEAKGARACAQTLPQARAKLV